MIRHFSTFVGALVACALLAPAAPAQEAGKLVAIQQRKYRLGQELTLGGVFEPQDAFTKGLAVEGAYTWHFGELWSWEVLRGGYFAQLNTPLRNQLERDFGVLPTAFETLQYSFSSSLVYTPLYGKFALRNASLVHAEAFVDFGVAGGRFTSSYAAGPEVGAGVRVFFNQRLSLRVEGRDAFYVQHNSKNVIFLSLGLGIALGGTDG